LENLHVIICDLDPTAALLLVGLAMDRL